MKWLLSSLFVIGVTMTLVNSLPLSPSLFHNENGGDTWVVLVAGSNGYYNYRHQADVCHAYQIAKSHGVPDERIIVMMYDDIAQSDQNPRKGVIINKPNGPNVYKGVPKDYIGDQVTPQNFFKVLAGDKELKAAGKKVLGSSSKDNVFIYFSDHGAPGLIAFPDDTMSKKQLTKAIDDLESTKRFNKMVIYIEACYSGSMFDEGALKNDTRIWALTAANSEESSYAYYYDATLQTYLGDEFSVRWLEDSDAHDLKKETLEQQYQTVEDQVLQSHVQNFGDQSLKDLTLANFQAASPSYPSSAQNSFHIEDTDQEKFRVDSRDVPIMIESYQTFKTSDFTKLDMMLKKRELADAWMTSLASVLQVKFNLIQRLDDGVDSISHVDCHHQVLNKFHTSCYNLSHNLGLLKYVRILSNACERTYGLETEQIVNLLSSYCPYERPHDFEGVL